jgi:predicted acyl esterase
MVPYNKDGRSGVGGMDAYHRHFAARGYNVLHIDMRGTGSSEGKPYRSFDRRERQDGHAAVEWVAAQSWCDGAVGIWGASYGGITAMAIAETAPPHLRAIVPVHAPFDNHDSMIVHNDARLMFWPDPHWGASMAASMLMPPLRATDGPDWLRTWRERFDVDPWIFDWYGELPEPEFNENRRIDAGKIAVPSLVICGWQDAYPDSVNQLWPKLTGPKRLVLGPWKHVMPEQSPHEPVDTLTLIDRWWDRWLRNEENGVDAEPPVAIFVQGEERWRSEAAWPLARISERRFSPAEEGLLADEPASGTDDYVYDARVGLQALPYDACTGPIPYPQDQSDDDRLSLSYTTAPLDDALEIGNCPSVTIRFSASVPPANLNLVAKLGDVAPDGNSSLVTFEVIAGSRAIPAGDDRYEISFPLRPTSYVFKPGHRIRLALSGGNFPYLWPSPYQYRLSLDRSGTSLTLPIVSEQVEALPEPGFGPPPELKPAGKLGGAETYWTRREETGRTVSFEGRRASEVAVEAGTVLSIDQTFAMTVDAGAPAHANTVSDAVWELRRATGAVRTRVKTLTTLDGVHLHAEIDLDGFPYFRHEWSKSRHT